LLIENFSKDSSTKSGLNTSCKKCSDAYNKEYRIINKKKLAKKAQEYYIENKEKIDKYSQEYRSVNGLEAQRKFREKHKIEISNKRRSQESKEKRKIYYENNKEKIREKERIYILKNKERINENTRVRYQYNKEKQAERHKKWQSENKEVVNIIAQRRRSRKKALPSTLTIEQWENIKLHFNNKCCYCGQEKLLVQEHFNPVVNLGAHDINNILPSCKNCNSSKGPKLFENWYSKYRYYSKKRERKILEYLNYNNDYQQLKII